MARPELSLVIPIYNEEEVLPQLDARLKDLLTRLAIDTEVVFVNDGSRDASIELLRRMASHEERYRVVSFSRNFGHQRAITAGMDQSRGRAVVVMDADLQDPPEVILEMVARWQEGYDVVYGRRRSREGESWFKLITAKLFYRLFAAMIPIEVPLDTGDFRLMSRRVVLTMRGLRETHRFVRGLVAWVGFRQTAVEYDRAARAAGETKYPLRKMLAFAIDGIASFSILPLRMATYVGVLVAIGSVLLGVAAIVSKYAGLTVPGWTTTVVLLSFLFSVQFVMIGVLGEYVGRIYEQVKRRPLYIVSERINFRRARRRRAESLGDELKTPVVPRPPPVPASVRPHPASGTPPLPPAAANHVTGPLPMTASAEPVRSRPPPVPSSPPGATTPSAPPLAPTPFVPPAAPTPPSPSRRPTSKTPPPPPKLSSSVANIHVALPVKASDPPPKASAAAAPPAGPPAKSAVPSSPPMRAAAPTSGSMKAAPPASGSMRAAPAASTSMKSVPPTSTSMKSVPPASTSMKSVLPTSGSMNAAPPTKAASVPPARAANVPPARAASVPPVKAAGAVPMKPAAPASGSMKSIPPVTPASSSMMKTASPAQPASGSMKAAPPSVPPQHPKAPSVPPMKATPSAPPVKPTPPRWDPATADAITKSDDKRGGD